MLLIILTSRLRLFTTFTSLVLFLLTILQAFGSCLLNFVFNLKKFFYLFFVFLSWLVLSCLVLSCLVLSCLVLSRLFFFFCVVRLKFWITSPNNFFPFVFVSFNYWVLQECWIKGQRWYDCYQGKDRCSVV